MDECAKQRKLLSEEFQKDHKACIALSDEPRQQIFFAVLERETVGIRVSEITKCTQFWPC